MQEFKNSTLAIFQRGPEWLIGFQKIFFGGFYKTNIEEKCSFDYNLHFLTKKKFFAKILGFLRFSQIQGPSGKI